MHSTTSLGSQGLGALKSRYVAGVLIFYHPTTGAELFRIDPAVTGGYIMPGMLRQIRARLTVAQINAGVTLLAALVGFKYRMVFAEAIAIGGAVGATTTLDILGTQTTAVKLVAFAQANLTQSTLLRPGATGATILADGASYVANDANTAVTVGKTGSSLTVATHVDLNFGYVIEP